MKIEDKLNELSGMVDRLTKMVEKGDVPGHPFRGNQFSGGGGGSSSAGSTHSVSLPKNPKKLNIDTAAEAMRQMGYEVKPAGFNMQSQQAEYHVTDRSGNARRMTSREVRYMVYAGAGKG